ncbi:MAG: cell division protein SepF [Actinomycetota bacterium]
MGFFKKTMAYLGLVDDEECDEYAEQENPEATDPSPYKSEPNVRKLHPREMKRDLKAPTVAPHPRAPVRPVAGGLKNAMHIIEPKGFGDAEQIGERFRQNIPVLMNLQYVDNDLGKRLIDFSSGLTYGLGGSIQRAAEKVFLLVPASMEVSAEDKLRMQEQGLFNQF